MTKDARLLEKLVDHGIRAALFDLDGVLVDAADWHKDAFNETLVSYGLSPITDEEHKKTFNGLSTRRKIEILNKSGYGISSQYTFYKKKQEFTVFTIEERCVPNPRVIKTIELANRLFRGQIAVVTNCSRATATLMLEKAGLLHLFKFLICNEDVRGNIKPHPLPYILGVDRLNLKNKQVLAVDDTDKGIMSAIEAGCRTWRINKFDDLTPDRLLDMLDFYRITI